MQDLHNLNFYIITLLMFLTLKTQQVKVSVEMVSVCQRKRKKITRHDGPSRGKCKKVEVSVVGKKESLYEEIGGSNFHALTLGIYLVLATQIVLCNIFAFINLIYQRFRRSFRIGDTCSLSYSLLQQIDKEKLYLLRNDFHKFK